MHPPTLRTRLSRGAREFGWLPPPRRTPEERLLLAVLARALLDGLTHPQARAWLDTEAFDELCELVDVPAAALRRVVEADPKALRKCVRAMG
jgi:hypothetical protein